MELVTWSCDPLGGYPLRFNLELINDVAQFFESAIEVKVCDYIVKEVPIILFQFTRLLDNILQLIILQNKSIRSIHRDLIICRVTKHSLSLSTRLASYAAGGVYQCWAELWRPRRAWGQSPWGFSVTENREREGNVGPLWSHALWTTHLRMQVQNAYSAGVNNLTDGIHGGTKQMLLIFPVLNKFAFPNICFEDVSRYKVVIFAVCFILLARTTCVC